MNLDELIRSDFPVVRQDYTEDDAIRYALGVGLGIDPVDRFQLRFVYENAPGGVVALPSMAVVLAYQGHFSSEPRFGLDWRRILHVGQSIQLHRPLPASGSVWARNRVISFIDKGKDKGALMTYERQIHAQADDALIATVTTTTLARGDGGQGGFGTTGIAASPPIPARPADLVSDFATSLQIGLVYRMSGDRNPLHIDPDIALAAGYDRPILHGLCTYGIACHQMVALACEGEPDRLRGFACRLTSLVFPGETLRTEVWREAGSALFRVSVPARGVTVLDGGYAEIDD